MNRRQLLKGIAASTVCSGFAWSLKVEPNWIEVTSRTIALNKNPQRTVRLVHISDLHYSNARSLDRIRSAVDLALASEPQVVCITGDFIDKLMPKEAPYRAVLEQLTKYVPTLGITGNHDGGGWVGSLGGYKDASLVYDFARSAGITMLENESLKGLTDKAGSDLGMTFVGIGDIWANNAEPTKAFSGIVQDGKPIVLLSHNPDSKDLVRHQPWDLMLSGHTHGGQVVIPVANLAPGAPIGDPNFVAGICPWGERVVHVNRGIGSVFGMRFNCRPEVSVLDLKV